MGFFFNFGDSFIDSYQKASRAEDQRNQFEAEQSYRRGRDLESGSRYREEVIRQGNRDKLAGIRYTSEQAYKSGQDFIANTRNTVNDAATIADREATAIFRQTSLENQIQANKATANYRNRTLDKGTELLTDQQVSNFNKAGKTDLFNNTMSRGFADSFLKQLGNESFARVQKERDPNAPLSVSDQIKAAQFSNLTANAEVNALAISAPLPVNRFDKKPWNPLLATGKGSAYSESAFSKLPIIGSGVGGIADIIAGGAKYIDYVGGNEDTRQADAIKKAISIATKKTEEFAKKYPNVDGGTLYNYNRTVLNRTRASFGLPLIQSARPQKEEE